MNPGKRHLLSRVTFSAVLGGVTLAIGFAAAVWQSLDREDWRSLSAPALVGPDLPFYLAVGARQADPNLYPQDDLLIWQAKLVPPVFPRALVTLSNRLGEPAACRLLWLVLNAVFLLGLAAAAHVVAGWLAAAFTLSLTLASFSHPLPGTILWGVIPPWEVTSAGVGWTAAVVVSALLLRAETSGRALICGLVVSLVAFVHPPTALHAAMVGTMSCLIWGRNRKRRAIAVALGSAIGLAWYAVKYAEVRGWGAPARAVISTFAPSGAGLTWNVATNTALYLVIPMGLSLLWWFQRPAFGRAVLGLVVGGVSVMSVSILATHWFSLAPGQWLRASLFPTIACYVGAGAGLAGLCRPRRMFGACAATAALLIFIGGHGQLVYQALKPLKDFFVGHNTLFPVMERREEPVSMTSIADLAAWCRRNLPPNAHVLVPPRHFLPFRAMSRRGVVVVELDRATSWYLPAYAHEWWVRYEGAKAAYTERGNHALLHLARRYRAGYVVVPRGRRWPGRPLYQNGQYAIYPLS